MGISWLLTYPSIPNEFLFLCDFFSLYKEKKSQKKKQKRSSYMTGKERAKRKSGKEKTSLKKKHLTFPSLEGVKGE